jgi:hypothetical protein
MCAAFDILWMKQQIHSYDFYNCFVDQEMQFLLGFEGSMQLFDKWNNRLEELILII